MKLLVVSVNPLFTEVLNAALEKHDNFELSVVAPCEFDKVLATVESDVIFIDQDLGRVVFEPIITTACEKTFSRIILLNPKDNHVCVLDSHRTTIQEIDDLCQAIGLKIINSSANGLQGGDEAHSESDKANGGGEQQQTRF